MPSASVASLENELDAIARQLTETWPILPSTDRRFAAGLVERSGSSDSAMMSPSKTVDLAALQAMYTPSKDQFGGIPEFVKRVRGVVDDGKVLVERVVRLGQEREVLKSNAAKAKKLVEDSRSSLETYQR